MTNLFTINYRRIIVTANVLNEQNRFFYTYFFFFKKRENKKDNIRQFYSLIQFA